MPSNVVAKDLVPVLNVLDNQGIIDRSIEIKKNVEKVLGRLKADKSTVAVLQGVFKDGKKIRIITTMDNSVYKYLQQNKSTLLKIGEILGPEPIYARELVAGKLKEYIFGSIKLPVHAEQLCVEYAESLGIKSGYIATSNLGCPMCEAYIKEYYSDFKHLNLKSYNKAVRDAKNARDAADKALKKVSQLEKEAAKAADISNSVTRNSIVKKLEKAKETSSKAVELANNLEAELKVEKAISKTGNAGDLATEVRYTASRATDARHTANRATDATSTVAKTENAVDLATDATSTVTKIAREEKVLAKVSKFESALKYGFKGTKFIGKIGKYFFIALDVTGINLLGDIMLTMDVFDYILDWLKRDEIEERKEWMRITKFLFGLPKLPDMPLMIDTGYGNNYVTCFGDHVNRIIKDKICSPQYNYNLNYWLEKWNKHKEWNGFVYSQVITELERQSRAKVNRQAFDPDIDYNTKYELKNSIEVTLTDSPQKSTKKEEKVGELNEYSIDNFTTRGKPFPHDGSTHVYTVNSVKLTVRYTVSIPCLTPFDFIIEKCKILSSLIISFLSKYDAQIVNGMSPFINGSFISTYDNNYVLYKYVFQHPLDHDAIHFCLQHIMSTTWRLSQHIPQEGDFDVDKNQNNVVSKGWFRRQKILFNLVKPNLFVEKSKYDFKGKTLFREIGLKLNSIVKDLNKLYLLKPIDLELEYITNKFLCEFAFDIDSDIKKALKDSEKNSQFGYKGTSALKETAEIGTKNKLPEF